MRPSKVRFDSLMEVTMQITINWDTTPCSLVEISLRFTGTNCHHLHSIRTSSMRRLQRRYFFFYHSKRRQITKENNLIVTGNEHWSSYRSTSASFVSNV